MDRVTTFRITNWDKVDAADPSAVDSLDSLMVENGAIPLFSYRSSTTPGDVLYGVESAVSGEKLLGLFAQLGFEAKEE